MFPMAVKTEQDLSDNARSLWLKAISALELRNFGYAISLLQAVLKETPDFLDARKMLRRSEVQATKGKKSFLSGISTASLKGGSMVKKDPVAAMELAEKSLESDPYNHQANMLLRDAAKAAGMPEVAAFALETLAEGAPKDTKILHELGAHYYENGLSEKAIDVYTRIAEMNPSDLIAIKRGKDAAARHSMASGGWEEVATSGGSKDYRDLIKNKEEAVSLEQQNRVVKSDEMIEQQLGELGEKYEQNPQNVDVTRRIAALYEQKGDLENALTWYSYTSDLTKGTDPAMARKVTDIGLKILEAKIAEFESWLAENGEAENAPEVRAQYDELRKQKADLLISDARRRVERNPTDLQFRYELGEELVRAGMHTEAIPELQRARQNPSVRLKAMNLLGQCYVGKHMLDLAKNTFAAAVAEILIMDDNKKEMLYQLGLVHEQLREKEKYLDCMKQIYEIDYGYRDVATRVEQSYGG